MKEFLLRMDRNTDRLLELYLKKNKIKSKNKAINDIVDYFLENAESFNIIRELNKKIDKMIKIENLNNNLIEQLFANHEFPVNNNRNEDEILKEFKENMKNKFYLFMD